MREYAVAMLNFWKQITGAAYPSTQVPSNAKLPYVVYTLAKPNYGETTISPTTVYTASSGLDQTTTYADKIEKLIHPKYGYTVLLPNGKGAFHLRRNPSWAEPVATEDNTVEAMYFAVEIKSFIF